VSATSRARKTQDCLPSAALPAQQAYPIFMFAVTTDPDPLVGASRQRITERLSEFERTGILRDGHRLIIMPNHLLALVHGDKPQPGDHGDGNGAGRMR
jgi:hypothetical protein